MAGQNVGAAGPKGSESDLNPRVLSGLVGALVRGSIDFVSQSIRLGGNVVGDIGGLFADRVDSAGRRLDDRVNRGVGHGGGSSADRRSRSRPDSVRNVFNRAVDGCVDVLESSVNTFEEAYDRHRRFDFVAGPTTRVPESGVADELIHGYELLNADVVITHIERLDDPDHVRSILAYEKQNKDREAVIAAGQAHLEKLLANAGSQSVPDNE
jgi:hypothetical protein